MVFNYRSLNDNTYKDQYSLPGSNGRRIHSLDSLSSTRRIILMVGNAFWSEECTSNLPKKDGQVVEFDEESMKTKKGLRSFLGILNYARQHIPKLGILLRPLYEKTNAHGDKRLKPSDYQIIGEIKKKVQQLPDLSIPPEDTHIILEVDGCMEGWGGIVKWKQKKNDPRSTEKVCAYASGKFTNVQSTIDAEINACINTLEKLKIYYLDKQEITLRTDCQAIISFYKKTSSSKASRVRWMKFAGVKIEIEHIEGKHNVLADSLSRLVNSCIVACTAKEKESQMKKVTRAAAEVVDNVLTMKGVSENEGNLHGTSQTKEQEIYKQISQISNHCHQTLLELSKPKNQHGNTKESKEKLTPTQSMHKSIVEKDQEITTSKTFGPKYPPKPLKLEDYYKKPKSSSICSDTQSEESEDDDIIVDPGCDDFCLTSAKLPRMEAHRLGKKTRYCRI
ncbi:putative polyprotein [Tanacetum coccineum]